MTTAIVTICYHVVVIGYQVIIFDYQNGIWFITMVATYYPAVITGIATLV